MLGKLIHEGVKQLCVGMYSKSEVRLSVYAMVLLHASGTQFFKESNVPIDNFWESATVNPLFRVSDFSEKNVDKFFSMLSATCEPQLMTILSDEGFIVNGVLILEEVRKFVEKYALVCLLNERPPC